MGRATTGSSEPSNQGFSIALVDALRCNQYLCGLLQLLLLLRFVVGVQELQLRAGALAF